MEDLAWRLSEARKDSMAMEQLVTDYLPFMKKQLATLKDLPLEFDDMLSLAMLTFVGCVRQYEEQRGGFMGFCAACIRNRLIDEARRQKGHAAQVLPLEAEGVGDLYEEQAAIAAYDRQEERAALAEEIDSLSSELAELGVVFAELPRICPKQRRSREQCLMLARYIAGDDASREQFLRQHTLPQKQLAVRFGLSPKTIEKHRQYIVTLVVLLLGDYTGIRAFLPQYGEVSR